MQDFDDPDLDGDIQDRLIHVENSLYFLKAKARYFPNWDNAEIERLERLRQDLSRRYERSRQITVSRRRGDIPRASILSAAAPARPGRR